MCGRLLSSEQMSLPAASTYSERTLLISLDKIVSSDTPKNAPSGAICGRAIAYPPCNAVPSARARWSPIVRAEWLTPKSEN